MSYFIVQGFPVGGPGGPGQPPYPDNTLPPVPGVPTHPWVPPAFPSHPWLPGHLPGHLPIDPPAGIGPNHPLFWLIPLLLRPATTAATVPPPAAHPEKPDITKPGEWVMVALGAGSFKWAWVESTASSGAEPK